MSGLFLRSLADDISDRLSRGEHSGDPAECLLLVVKMCQSMLTDANANGDGSPLYQRLTAAVRRYSRLAAYCRRELLKGATPDEVVAWLECRRRNLSRWGCPAAADECLAIANALETGDWSECAA